MIEMKITITVAMNENDTCNNKYDKNNDDDDDDDNDGGGGSDDDNKK